MCVCVSVCVCECVCVCVRVCVCVCVFHILCHLNLWAREDMSLVTFQDPLGSCCSAPIQEMQSSLGSNVQTTARTATKATSLPSETGTRGSSKECSCASLQNLAKARSPRHSHAGVSCLPTFGPSTFSHQARACLWIYDMYPISCWTANYYRRCQRQALRATHTRKPRRLSCFCRLAGASDNNLLAEAPTSAPLPSEDRSQKRVGQDLPSYPFQGFCGFPASVYVSFDAQEL